MTPDLSTKTAGNTALEKVRTPRRRRTTKRKTVGELSYVERRAIPAEFDIRGAGSDAMIAESCQAQRAEVQSILLSNLFHRVRLIEATLVIRGASMRKPPFDGSGLRAREATEDCVIIGSIVFPVV